MRLKGGIESCIEKVSVFIHGSAVTCAADLAENLTERRRRDLEMSGGEVGLKNVMCEYWERLSGVGESSQLPNNDLEPPFADGQSICGKAVQIEEDSTERRGRRRPEIWRESAGKSAVEGHLQKLGKMEKVLRRWSCKCKDGKCFKRADHKFLAPLRRQFECTTEQ
jgi:hypothetical protein